MLVIMSTISCNYNSIAKQDRGWEHFVHVVATNFSEEDEF